MITNATRLLLGYAIMVYKTVNDGRERSVHLNIVPDLGVGHPATNCYWLPIPEGRWVSRGGGGLSVVWQLSPLQLKYQHSGGMANAERLVLKGMSIVRFSRYCNQGNELDYNFPLLVDLII